MLKRAATGEKHFLGGCFFAYPNVLSSAIEPCKYMIRYNVMIALSPYVMFILTLTYLPIFEW